MVDTNKAVMQTEKEFEAKEKDYEPLQEDENDTDFNDDMCEVCNLGGYLICCDGKGCPKSYHLKCANLPALPKGEWRCPECEEEF